MRADDHRARRDEPTRAAAAPPSAPRGAVRRARSLACPGVALLLAVLAVPAELSAQDEPDDGSTSTEGALFLLLPTGAKAVGMARAMTSLAGPESVWWNPAGLGEVEGNRVLVYRGDHPVAGEATAASLVLAGALGAGAVSYQLIDVGSQDVTDIEGNVIGTLTGRNHLGVVSLAARLQDLVSLGVNVKLVRFQFSCRGQCQDAGVSATSVATDVGALLTRPWGLPLRLGAMIAHAGSDFGTGEEADPLPTRVRLAAAYEVLGHIIESEELTLTLAAEVEDRWRGGGSPATYLGTEFTAGTTDVLYVRAGYVLGAEQQLDGAAVGVGLRYERFDLGLAKSLASSPVPGESEPIHISFGFHF